MVYPAQEVAEEYVLKAANALRLNVEMAEAEGLV